MSQPSLVLLVVLALACSSATTSDSSNSAVTALEWAQQAAPHSHARGLEAVDLTSYYKRTWTWMLPEAHRHRAITNFGSAERLRVVVDKLTKGGNVTVALIGGSITQGQGAAGSLNWSQWFKVWAHQNYPGRVTVHNGALAGTVSSYMSVCHSLHVPRDADVVLVEYTVNDPAHLPPPPFANDHRAAYERLLRKLLQYPRRPAVVLLHAYSYLMVKDHAYWKNAESEFHEFATYYHLPELSLKAAVWPLWRASKDGFVVTHTGNQRADMKDKLFFYDNVHPYGATGHKVLAEMAAHLVSETAASLAQRPLAEWERSEAAAPLAAPMIHGNWDSVSEACFIGGRFTSAVVKHEGWEYVNEAKGMARPKYGYVSNVPGSRLEIEVSTLAQGGAGGGGGDDAAPPSVAAAAAAAGSPPSILVLAYLQSYVQMGTARVECVSGCTCKPVELNAHAPQWRNSQLHTHRQEVTQHARCRVAVTVLPATSSGQHKFKVSGVMVVEAPRAGIRPGSAEWANNNMALEYVHDISMRGSGGIFEVHNHAL